MTNLDLAKVMFPNVTLSLEDLEKRYPSRGLKEGEVVSRYAPSPTGFVHIGNMLACFIEDFLPKKYGGKFFLRIEDTDQKRELVGGVENILNAMKALEINQEEGVVGTDKEIGDYGSYTQSKRQEIYDVVAKYMIENDLAYPCFLTEEELEEIRKNQEITKSRIGIYGKWAKYREMPIDKAIEYIKEGKPYTIRLKSTGDFEKKIVLDDLIKGKIVFPENDIDIVLLKANGIPVYHFAHLVDDHFMRVTHVLRGEDWLSSVPVHFELFNKMGYKIPKYAHLGLVMIVDDNGNKRKISKRKDVDFTVEKYIENGFISDVLKEYLMTIANSGFEIWRQNNPNTSIYEFDFDFSKVGASPLFDYSKLVNISKNYLSKLSNIELYDLLLNWTKKYDTDFEKILEENKEYALEVLNIEREKEKPRKDYYSLKSIKELSGYMFDDIFEKEEKEYEWQKINEKDEIKDIVLGYFKDIYDEKDDHNMWFEKMKQYAETKGYAGNMKEYKKNPDSFKGNVADIATVIRVSITKRAQSPDLYEILKVLGKDRIEKRISRF